MPFPCGSVGVQHDVATWCRNHYLHSVTKPCPAPSGPRGNSTDPSPFSLHGCDRLLASRRFDSGLLPAFRRTSNNILRTLCKEALRSSPLLLISSASRIPRHYASPGMERRRRPADGGKHELEGDGNLAAAAALRWVSRAELDQVEQTRSPRYVLAVLSDKISLAEYCEHFPRPPLDNLCLTSSAIQSSGRSVSVRVRRTTRLRRALRSHSSDAP